MLNRQIDKKYISNQRKRIVLIHQSKKRFFEIQNVISQKFAKKINYRRASLPRLINYPELISSLPNLNKLPIKYRDMIEIINDNNDENKPNGRRLPTLYLNSETIRGINNSLEYTMKRYRSSSKKTFEQIKQEVRLMDVKFKRKITSMQSMMKARFGGNLYKRDKNKINRSRQKQFNIRNPNQHLSLPLEKIRENNLPYPNILLSKNDI